MPRERFMRQWHDMKSTFNRALNTRIDKQIDAKLNERPLVKVMLTDEAKEWNSWSSLESMKIKLPTYAHLTDSGADVCLFIEEGEPEARKYGGCCDDSFEDLDANTFVLCGAVDPDGVSNTMIVCTGLRFQLPPGFEIQVRPRSGLAFKHDVTIVNSPGTLDEGYTGELKIKLINHNPEPIHLARFDRIAQIVIARVTRADFELVEEFTETTRGSGGFGSTGK